MLKIESLNKPTCCALIGTILLGYKIEILEGKRKNNFEEQREYVDKKIKEYFDEGKV